MSTTITATVVDGMLKPDVPLGLPNLSRVRVNVVAENTPDDAGGTEIESPVEAWNSLLQSLRQNPIHGGGNRFDRDALYDCL